MRILMVAPKICTPWTEGRKKYFIDLVEELNRYHQVSVAVSCDYNNETIDDCAWSVVYCRNTFQHVTSLVGHVRQMLADVKFDLVCYLPFGVFGGIRGIGNVISIKLIEYLARRSGAKVVSLMYSVSQEAKRWYIAPFIKDIVRNQFSPDERSVCYGLHLKQFENAAFKGITSKRLLFMAGMTEIHQERLDYVLNVRGLGVLLRAGKELYQRGYTLTVACPIFESDMLRKQLKELAINTWPEENLKILNEVSVPEIFAVHELFIFPYGREELQFVPTSVLEAMYNFVPVILSNCNFLQPFINGGMMHAWSFDMNNHLSLLSVLIGSEDDPDLESRTMTAYQFAQSFSIEKAVIELVNLAK
jgi:glycosyltransferase involved in cell wall biosynthesis